MQRNEQRNEPSNENENLENNNASLGSRVRKMLNENPDISDHDFGSGIREMFSNDLQSLGYSGNLLRLFNDSFRTFPRFTFPPLSPFFPPDSFFNDVYSDGVYPEKSRDEQEKENYHSSSYIKYSSSMTSFDKNGNKKMKSISEIERVKDGKRNVHKKFVTQDENGTVTEEIFPDGTKRTTTKQNALADE